jgi:kinesin family protein 18/19
MARSHEPMLERGVQSNTLFILSSHGGPLWFYNCRRYVALFYAEDSLSLFCSVRVRPPSTWEAARLPELIYDTTIRGDGALSLPERSSTTYSSVREIVQIVDDRILTFDPAEPDQVKAFVERGFIPPGTKRYKDRRFMFDRVFRPESSQQEVYDATARPLLQRLLDGFNTTVFAYGVSISHVAL